MSIYTECGEAARALLDDPSLRRQSTKGPAGIFTVLDVIFRAARNSSASEVSPAGMYSQAEMAVAQREASQVMGLLFRNRQVVRFGPVNLPDSDGPDYARTDEQIIYAPPGWLRKLKTPNGVFPRLYIQDDNIARPGRRLGAKRDDLMPWAEQRLDGLGSRPSSGAQREILILTAERENLMEQIEALRKENRELRAKLRGAVTKEDFDSLRDGLEEAIRARSRA